MTALTRMDPGAGYSACTGLWSLECFRLEACEFELHPAGTLFSQLEVPEFQAARLQAANAKRIQGWGLRV